MTCRIFLASLLGAALALTIAQTETRAQIVRFELEGKAGSGLLTGNETGTVNNSNATGGILSEITYDMDTNELFIDVGWGSGNGFVDLSGDATGMHIHGPANFNESNGVKYNFEDFGDFNSSASSGGYTGTVTLASEDDEADLLNGLFYINVHTNREFARGDPWKPRGGTGAWQCRRVDGVVWARPDLPPTSPTFGEQKLKLNRQLDSRRGYRVFKVKRGDVSRAAGCQNPAAS